MFGGRVNSQQTPLRGDDNTVETANIQIDSSKKPATQGQQKRA